jgi:hypothetical protein
VPCPGLGGDTRNVLRVLKVATKYCAGSLQKRCVEQLEYIFPATLPQWDSRRIRLDLPSLYAALVAAETLQLLWIVPQICCCILAQTGYVDPALRYVPIHVISQLPPTQGISLLSGAPTFLAGTRFILDEMRFIGSQCPLEGCESDRQELLTYWEENASVDPFSFGIEDGIWDQALDEICLSCQRSSKDCWVDGRSKLWEVLPTSFGYGSWEQLNDLRSAWQASLSD